MSNKYYQHNNMILDLTKKRISKVGVEIIDIDNENNNCHFILRYLSENYVSYTGDKVYQNKLHRDRNNKKTLELCINKTIENNEENIENLKNALVIARKYADSVELDLIAEFPLNNDCIVNSITKKTDSNRIFPMLHSELCQLAENNISLIIKPKEKESLRHTYVLPDRLKTKIIIEEKRIYDINIEMRSENKISYDFSNLHIDNNTCDDKYIKLNIDKKNSIIFLKNGYHLENIIRDTNFKPPTSTCIKKSSGRNFFNLFEKIGLLSKKMADIFYEKNEMSIIDTINLTKELNQKISLYEKEDIDTIKEIVDRLLYINRKNENNDIFLIEDYKHIEDKLIEFKKKNKIQELDIKN